MKNSEEFRSLVFEKAKNYEIRRRARTKKIAGSAVVCSLILALSLPISLHLYYEGARPSDLTTAETKASHETAAEASTTPAALTTSTAATTTHATTTVATTVATTRPETTSKATTERTVMHTTTEYTTESTATTTTYDEPVPPQITESTPIDETAVFDSETYQLFVGDHFTIGAMPYENFIEHYHGARVLTQKIENEDALLSYLESHAELYGGKIMSIMDFFDAKYFYEHDLLIVESPHRVQDITPENGEVTVILGEVMSKNSVINLIVIDKDDHFSITSIWY